MQTKKIAFLFTISLQKKFSDRPWKYCTKKRNYVQHEKKKLKVIIILLENTVYLQTLQKCD